MLEDGHGGLPVRVTYPDLNPDSGLDQVGHPLIVFSHGLLGSKDGYQALVRYLVGHGYVVIAATHADSAVYRKPKLSELKDMTPLFVHWARRPADVSLMLDNIGAIEAAAGRPGLVDRKKMAMAGHSFGAHTGCLLAGAVPIQFQTAADMFFEPRLSAFLLISPQGTGLALTEESAFGTDSFRSVKQPVMFITGTLDNFKRGQDYKWRSEPFHLVCPGSKHLMVIDQGHHGFGGIAGTRFPGAGPDNAEHVALVKAAMLAFFETYMRDCREAEKFLLDGMAQLNPSLRVHHR